MKLVWVYDIAVSHFCIVVSHISGRTCMVVILCGGGFAKCEVNCDECCSMSFSKEPWPASGFVDVFRVCAHVLGTPITVAAFEQQERANARFLFTVRPLRARTLRIIKKEGLLPLWLSDPEFCVIHRIHSGTIVAYMSRMVVKEALSQHGLVVGTDFLSVTTDEGHAEALADQERPEDGSAIIYRIRLPACEQLLIARGLLRTEKPSLDLIEAALARAHELQSPVRVVNRGGRPYWSGRGRKEAALLQSLFDASLPRQPQFCRAGEIEVLVFGKLVKVPRFTTYAMAASELRYVWWHREARLRRFELGLGLMDVHTHRIVMGPSDPAFSSAQKLYGSRRDIKSRRVI